jgi:hypothetical protein
MTAAAIATMATVEAATTTRPFYLVVPGRNRARLRARIDHLSFLATIWTPRVPFFDPGRYLGACDVQPGHSTRPLPTHDPSRARSGRGDGRPREMGGLSLAASCQKAQRRVGTRS